ncbi:MAG: hypothetical protein ACTSU2_09475 [Promethearchaeota archaeon]
MAVSDFEELSEFLKESLESNPEIIAAIIIDKKANVLGEWNPLKVKFNPVSLVLTILSYNDIEKITKLGPMKNSHIRFSDGYIFFSSINDLRYIILYTDKDVKLGLTWLDFMRINKELARELPDELPAEGIDISKELEKIKKDYAEKYQFIISFDPKKYNKNFIARVNKILTEHNPELLLKFLDFDLKFMDNNEEYSKILDESSCLIWYFSPNIMSNEALYKKYLTFFYDLIKADVKVIVITEDYNGLPLPVRISWAVQYNEDAEVMAEDIISGYIGLFNSQIEA